MRTRLLKGLMALLICATAWTGLGTGVADASLGQCGSGYWCYWSGASYSGTFYSFSGSGNTGTIAVKSFYNNGATGRGVKWYSGSNYSGTYHGCTSVGYGSGSWNVTARSHKWNPTAGGQCTGVW